MLAAVLAVGVLALVVWVGLRPRRRGAQPRLLHQGAGRRSARPAAASRRRSSARSCSSRSRRRSHCPIGVLSRSTSSEFAPARIATADPALARRAERLPVDRDRHLRLHADRQGAAPGPRARATTRAPSPAASRSRSSCCRWSRARRWRCCALVPEPPPRGELRARRLEVATVLSVVLPTALRRDPDRHDARGRARSRRDGAAPLHLLDLRPGRRLEPGALRRSRSR